MKKLYILTLVATMFAACVTDAVNEPSVTIEDLAPETLTVSFEESRIQLQEGKTVWNEGDLVSVFYRSNANQKWQFQGATGDRTGNLKRVEMGTATETMNRVVVVYPYAENYYINPETYNVEASLPATQTYVADSYGVGGNIMVSYGEYNQVVLKSVCGWLKLELTGNGEKISTITLKGNNGEQVAGQLYINSADATAVLASEMGGAEDNGSAGGNLVFEDTILKEVTLSCSEGVVLGAEPTAFYIALPPQTFEKGISLEITATDGSTMKKSTEKEVVIERNHILPMAAFEVEFNNGESVILPPNNEIWYTAITKVEPHTIDAFGAIIILNEWDSVTGKGVITFDGNISKIGYNAFFECSMLTSITIPMSVTEIGSGAFAICSNLTSVTIPNSVTSIGYAAFEACGLTNITIPNSITKIERAAFYRCNNLASVIIPDSVTSIGNGAFSSCRNLTSFYGKFASADNRCLVIDGVLNSFAPVGLTEYTISNRITSIGEGAFRDCSSLTSITIPNSVTSIEYGAFRDCSSLTSVTIPNSVTSIGDYAFEGCSSLASVTIPNGVTSIGYQVFGYCTSLTSVTIPDSITSIGNYAFSYCSNLIGLTIGNSVTSIGSYAFYNCSRLTSVYCKPTTPPTGGSKMFYYYKSGSYFPIECKIYVPYNSVSVYKSATYWKEYASYIKGYNF